LASKTSGGTIGLNAAIRILIASTGHPTSALGARSSKGFSARQIMAVNRCSRCHQVQPLGGRLDGQALQEVSVIVARTETLVLKDLQGRR
jgi:hypothetical protein